MTGEDQITLTLRADNLVYASHLVTLKSSFLSNAILATVKV